MNRLRLSILLLLLCAASAPPADASTRPHPNKYEKALARRDKQNQKHQAKALKAWRKQHNVGQ